MVQPDPAVPGLRERRRERHLEARQPHRGPDPRPPPAVPGRDHPEGQPAPHGRQRHLRLHRQQPRRPKSRPVRPANHLPGRRGNNVLLHLGVHRADPHPAGREPGGGLLVLEDEQREGIGSSHHPHGGRRGKPVGAPVHRHRVPEPPRKVMTRARVTPRITRSRARRRKHRRPPPARSSSSRARQRQGTRPRRHPQGRSAGISWKGCKSASCAKSQPKSSPPPFRLRDREAPPRDFQPDGPPSPPTRPPAPSSGSSPTSFPGALRDCFWGARSRTEEVAAELGGGPSVVCPPHLGMLQDGGKPRDSPPPGLGRGGGEALGRARRGGYRGGGGPRRAAPGHVDPQPPTALPRGLAGTLRGEMPSLGGSWPPARPLPKGGAPPTPLERPWGAPPGGRQKGPSVTCAEPREAPPPLSSPPLPSPPSPRCPRVARARRGGLTACVSSTHCHGDPRPDPPRCKKQQINVGEVTGGAGGAGRGGQGWAQGHVCVCVCVCVHPGYGGQDTPNMGDRTPWIWGAGHSRYEGQDTPDMRDRTPWIWV
ncbi:basic salivary proline-rich protein 1-like, partial [Neopelma chrysocephalum]|uniref:basic salivary proline-rich protein 1-like n=1 Tax=Neopelma chrysocephalum TaxID=114329 RepID=UPI000FCD1376